MEYVIIVFAIALIIFFFIYIPRKFTIPMVGKMNRRQCVNCSYMITPFKDYKSYNDYLSKGYNCEECHQRYNKNGEAVN